MTLKKFITTVAGTLLVTGFLIQAKADATNTDPTGTYLWTMAGRNGGPDRTNTLVLNLAGDKLTGKLISPGRGGQTNSTEIADGKITGADISFVVIRSYNDNTFTNSYSGTLTNNTITGKIEFQRNGETRSRDWKAIKQE
ncbi:MAG: hypothetical protein ABSE48_19290 [Verrucomicrobiota bacterium]|jgi:hypothetical protein